MLKNSLRKVNEWLIYYNRKQKASIWSFIHQWNYEHTFTKNFLKATNNILIQMNKYHFFRWDWMIIVLGCFTGYIFSAFEDFYFTNKFGYKSAIDSMVAEHVLRNSAVSNKLKQAIVNNVALNPDMQYYVHQALLNQVLEPNKQQIKELITSSIKGLQNKETRKIINHQICQTLIPTIKQPVKDAALTFLNSQQMDRICANGLVSVLSSLYIKLTISSIVINIIKDNLKNNDNRELTYKNLRQIIIF